MMRRSAPIASRSDWPRTDPLDLFDPLAVQVALATVALGVGLLALGFAPPEGGATFRGMALRLCASLRLAEAVEIHHRCHDPSPSARPAILLKSRMILTRF